MDHSGVTRSRHAHRHRVASNSAPGDDSAPLATPSLLDSVNQAAWRGPRVITELGTVHELECWLDPGERAGLTRLAPEVRGRRALDVGVGTGRTVPIMRLLTDRYVAIDYTPEMVEVCRARYPDCDVRLGDARHLVDFDDATFGFVIFSFNGLDAVDHDDRQRALSEIARVLGPGGWFFYSTHNKSGPCFHATPFHPAGPVLKGSWSRSKRFERFAAGVAGNPMHLPRSVANWRRLRVQERDEGGWGIGPVEAHDFDLLVHFSTIAGSRSELAAAGLEPVAFYDAEHGFMLDPDVEHPDVRYFHVVARRNG
jgi:SAM-dependent methyltransferase